MVISGDPLLLGVYDFDVRTLFTTNMSVGVLSYTKMGC